MSAQAITESFRKPAPSEKIRILQQLWDEVAEEVAGEPLTESQRRLLDERIQQHDENPADVETRKRLETTFSVNCEPAAIHFPRFDA